MDCNEDMLYCHHCRQKRPESIVKSCSNSVDPKGVPCTKRYCKLCFDRFYPGLYNKVQLSNSSWICPYCSAYCCCTRCNNKKYPSYPPEIVPMEWDFENGLASEPTAIPIIPPSYTHKDDKKDYHQRTSVAIAVKSPHRSPKKRLKPVEATESDPAWAGLSLKYLQYAKKLALHSSVRIVNIRQLPSITHMIAISPGNGLDEGPWRWCDAYHAIKYLKDHGMVTTSRGAKGTSIKDELTTVDDLIIQLQLQSHKVTQQGEVKIEKVHVVVEQIPGMPEQVEFDMQIGDVISEIHLYERIKLLVLGNEAPSCGDLNLRLLGYADKHSGEYIHANMFTSISELIQDAKQIRVTVM